ncbi:hypothetical protein [Desulfamplus magnetovallimortis]|nr:hypothetical protein [Desulfamplus magnetovallimortis]
MTNKAMPDIVNVSYSMRDPAFRPAEMSHMESPYPYVIEYKIVVENPQEFEKILQNRLEKVKEGSSWFRASTEKAIAEIQEVNKILENRKLHKIREEKLARTKRNSLTFMDYIRILLGVAIAIFLSIHMSLEKYIENTFFAMVVLFIISAVVALSIFMLILLFKSHKNNENDNKLSGAERSTPSARLNPDQDDNMLTGSSAFQNDGEGTNARNDGEGTNARNDGEVIEIQNDGEVTKTQNNGESAETQNSRKVVGTQNSRKITETQNSGKITETQNSGKDADNQNNEEYTETPNNGKDFKAKAKKLSPPDTVFSTSYSTMHLDCYLHESKKHGINALYTDLHGNFFAHHSDSDIRSLSEKKYYQIKKQYGMKYQDGKWV